MLVLRNKETFTQLFCGLCWRSRD